MKSFQRWVADMAGSIVDASEVKPPPVEIPEHTCICTVCARLIEHPGPSLKYYDYDDM